MRLVIALCFLAGCMAQRPQPCKSPPLMSGALTVSTQDQKLHAYVQYMYDATGERIRLSEKGSYEKKPYVADYLLNYKENVVYKIYGLFRTCEKLPLKADFQPMGIPPNVSLEGQVVLGNSSAPGEGLLINVWTGDLPQKAGKFFSTVTGFGCIPVAKRFQTDQYGWVLMDYFNNVVGISDPNLLNPPSFCPQEETKREVEPNNFISLFLATNWL